MKITTLFTFILCCFSFSHAQNINDNKVSFTYTQLPLIKINDAFSVYEIRTEHSYLKANEDSLTLFEIRKEAAAQSYEAAMARYKRQRDSLDRIYLKQLSSWEIKVNAGATNPDGTAVPKPNPPAYPDAPVLADIDAPQLHSEYENGAINNMMKIEGYEEGLGGFIVTVDILPISNIHIVETKKGSGTATKYEYKCQYSLPIKVKVESPTQGVLLEQEIMGGTQSYGMSDQKSKYDHQLFMMDNYAKFFSDLERYARQRALQQAASYVNDQVGYVNKTRHAEIYSVNRFKDYDYSDVTNAYTATVQALALIKNDRDHSGAQEKLEAAMALWKEVMMESNTYDNKARINDKISAMIQCNMIEILFWQSNFTEAEATINLVLNTGVFKAKSHVKGEQSFYVEQQKRWNANY